MLCRRQDEATDVSRAWTSEELVSGAGTRRQGSEEDKADTSGDISSGVAIKGLLISS